MITTETYLLSGWLIYTSILQNEMIALPKILQEISGQLKSEEKCFLVGGAVRDLIFKREIQDFDFSCDIDPRVLARRIANRLDASFFILDEERLTSRVILQNPEKSPLVLDFSSLNGSIVEDLKFRDFTFNAMAIDLRNTKKIIDPLNGERDLNEGKLRLCGNNSFIDDPVRVIRAVRYATELEMQIETETLQLLLIAKNRLNQISLERKRDELFKILDNPRALPAVLLLKKLEILDQLGLNIDADRLAQFRALEKILSWIICYEKPSESENLINTVFASSISTFRNSLAKTMSMKNSSGHSRCEVDKYFLLMPKFHNEQHKSQNLEQVFSNEEKDLIRLLKNNFNLVLSLLESVEGISNRGAYQLFQKAGDAGIDLILLSLAKISSKLVVEINQDNWMLTVSNGARLLDIWFNHPEISRPDALLNGNEIMSELNIVPSPIIGRLLDVLKEEQAAGEIENKQQALALIQQKYQEFRGLLY